MPNAAGQGVESAESMGRPHPWPVIALFVVVCLLLMPGWLLPNGSPVSMLCFPGLIAVYTCVILPRRRAALASLGVHRPGTAGAYLTVVLLLAAHAASYAVPALLGLAQAQPPGPLEHLVMFIPLAVYEEVGWRGYLQEQVTDRLGARSAVVIVGLVWAGWHTGLFLTGELLGPQDSNAASAGFFVLSAILISIVLGYTRDTSGSVWPAVVAHAGLNYAQEFGDALFAHRTSSFDIASAWTNLLLLAALALVAWNRLGHHK